jgi:hypothetical protein
MHLISSQFVSLLFLAFDLTELNYAIIFCILNLPLHVLILMAEWPRSFNEFCKRKYADPLKYASRRSDDVVASDCIVKQTTVNTRE